MGHALMSEQALISPTHGDRAGGGQPAVHKFDSTHPGRWPISFQSGCERRLTDLEFRFPQPVDPGWGSELQAGEPTFAA